MAMVSLPHDPMIGFKRNKLDVVRGKYNEWAIEAILSSGAPIDLTGAVVHFTVWSKRKVREQELTYWDPIIDVSSNDPEVDVTDPAAGLLSIKLDRTTTEAIDPALYFYDLWYEESGLRIDLIQKAEFRVQE